jgi:hypothetical protein
VGLQSTAWQPGQVVRTVLSVMAAVFAESDAVISIMAQGGFLDFAANGSVTYTTAQGNVVTAYVTPDPSIPSQNPTGTPGWLDVLADSVYDVQRIQPTQATGPLAIVNTTGSTYSYSTGGYHVSSATATYTAEEAVSITPSSEYTVTAATYASSLWTIVTSAPNGLSVGSIVMFQGTGWTALDQSTVTGNSGFFVVTAIVSGTSFKVAGIAGTGSFTSATAAVFVALPVVEVIADVAGTTGNATQGQINNAITANIGVFVWNTGNMTGLPFENNQDLASRCRLKLQSLSPAGAAGAYSYVALTAESILNGLGIQVPGVVAGTPLLNNPPTRAVTTSNPTTGLVNLYVFGESTALDGSVSNLVNAATNTAPVQITTNNPHGMISGDFCYISGALGNTAVNGWWQITFIDSTNFFLNNSIGNGALPGGNHPIAECGNLGIVDYLIQSYVVPQTVTEFTQNATGVAINISATVYVPVQYVNVYLTQAAPLALLTAIDNVPIGGLLIPSTGSVGVPLSVIIQALFAAGGSPSYVKDVSVSSVLLNGANTDYALATNQVATLGIVTLNVIPA